MLRIDMKSKLIAKAARRNTKNNRAKARKKMGKKRKKCLTEDVILHKLLPFLPAKSLFRFKSVCRSWTSTISGGANFARDQCRSYASASGLFYVHDVPGQWKRGLIPVSPNAVGVPDPKLGFVGKTMTISASSNGLLLCSPRSVSDRMVVCNPATKECTTVKNPEQLDDYPPRVGFGFDPWDSPAGFVIVWVSFRSHDAADPFSREGECRFHVYRSTTGRWRASGEKVAIRWNRWHGSSVFAARQVHWHVNNTVLSFDPSKDVPRVTPLPAQGDRFAGVRHYWRLGEMGGRLSCINIVDRAELQVWLMGETNWAKVYSVPLAKIFGKNLEILESCGVEQRKTTMSGGDGEGETKQQKGKKRTRSRVRSLVRTCPIKPLPSLGNDMLFLWMRRRVFSYDLLTARLTVLHQCKTRSKCQFFAYINNLAAPLGENSGEHPIPQDKDSDML